MYSCGDFGGHGARHETGAASPTHGQLPRWGILCREGLETIPDRAEPSLFNYRMILAMESTARASSGSVPLRDADGVVSRLMVAWKAPKVNGG